MTRTKDITYFADETTYQLWLKQVEEERQNLIRQRRQKMAARKEFRAEGGCIGYLDDEKSKVSIIHSNGDLQIEEHARDFSASERNVAVLYNDGSVKVSGMDNAYGQKETTEWKGVTQVLAVPNCTYGVTENGETVAAGAAQDDVLNWKNIKMIFAGKNRIVGLKKDGTITISDYGKIDGAESAKQCENWSDITEAVMSGDCLIGLTQDGHVLFSGKQNDVRRQAEEWNDIISVAADNSFVYGLTKDGQIKIAGTCAPYLDLGRSDVPKWSEQEPILALAAGSSEVAAVTEYGELKMAGTMGDAEAVCKCWNREIRPIIITEIPDVEEA